MIKYILEIESEDNEIKEYEFHSEELGSLNEVQDEILIENGELSVIKKIGFTKEFLSYVLETPVKTKIDLEESIELFEGNNVLKIKDLNGNYLITYLLISDSADILTTKRDVSSTVGLLDNQIVLKVDREGIISQINQSSEEVLIDSEKIGLEGYTTINDGFSVDLEGSMQCGDAIINGGIINKSGIYTTLSFGNNTREMYYSARAYGGLSYIGYNEYNKRVPVLISYSIPKDFVVVNAYLIVRHQSVTWQFSASPNTRAANIEVYLKELALTSSITFENRVYYAETDFSNYIGTRIDNVWGSGVHGYTFPTGYKIKRTADISDKIKTIQNGIIAIAPRATSVTFSPSNPVSPERDFSSFLGARLYIYGYLNKE